MSISPEKLTVHLSYLYNEIASLRIQINKTTHQEELDKMNNEYEEHSSIIEKDKINRLKNQDPGDIFPV